VFVYVDGALPCRAFRHRIGRKPPLRLVRLGRAIIADHSWISVFYSASSADCVRPTARLADNVGSSMCGDLLVASGLIPLKTKDFRLAFSGINSAYKRGNYETCSNLHLSDPRALRPGFRRPATALSGKTDAAFQRPGHYHWERFAPNAAEQQRSKVTGVDLRAASAPTISIGRILFAFPQTANCRSRIRQFGKLFQRKSHGKRTAQQAVPHVATALRAVRTRRTRLRRGFGVTGSDGLLLRRDFSKNG
jgi:hypothetical protein